MIALSQQQFEDFQNVVLWENGSPLPDGRVLGPPNKNGHIVSAADFRVAAVAERFAPAGKTILELGPCEGYYTVQLARLCKHLTAVELRPKNLVCTLIRLFLHEVKNVDLLLKDVRDLDASFGRFDILFHAGVFYHLDDPVSHLFKVSSLAPRLLLDTHYLADGDKRYPAADLHHGGKTYRAVSWNEAGWNDVWAGAQPTSRLLFLDSLMELLQDAGFHSVQVVANGPHAFAPRIALLAERTGNLPRNAKETVSANVLAAKAELLARELTAARQEIDRVRRAEKPARLPAGEDVDGRFVSTAAPDDVLWARPRRVNVIDSTNAEMLHRERVYLYATVLALAPQRCLEVGVGQGGSTRILHAALQDLGRGRLVAVDPAPALAFPAESLGDRVSWLTGASPAVLQQARDLAEGLFDFVLWDADCRPRAIRADLEGIAAVTRAGAHVLIHDAYNQGVAAGIDAVLTAAPLYLDAGIVSTTRHPGRIGGCQVEFAGFRLLIRTERKG